MVLLASVLGTIAQDRLVQPAKGPAPVPAASLASMCTQRQMPANVASWKGEALTQGQVAFCKPRDFRDPL